MSGGTSYAPVTGPRPAFGAFLGFHHVHWLVGNAKISADYFVSRFGFSRIAYRGLETGSRSVCSHVVRQGRITFVLSSPLCAGTSSAVLGDATAHIAAHGDGVKDVALEVEDARAVYAYAVSRGAKSVVEPAESSDEHGSVVTATVQTFGDTVHTFVQRGGYRGPFLPGFRDDTARAPDAYAGATPPVGLDFIDHCVGNTSEGDMEPTVQWYERHLAFHRFWSVDDKQMHTEFSALRSIVVADHDEVVKMPVNEPAPGKRKSQIQEYCDYYGGAGVQHIAMNTSDILGAVANLRARGVNFLRVPDTYYESLEARLKHFGVTVKEDLATIRKLNILVDMDEKGYLLQLFTQCIQDRPTVFLEVIQRAGCSGFGAGNFKSLFEAIEREQAERGNLTVTA